jgi:hypothetical protein
VTFWTVAVTSPTIAFEAKACTAGLKVDVPFCSSVSFCEIGVFLEKKVVHVCLTALAASAVLKVLPVVGLGVVEPEVVLLHAARLPASASSIRTFRAACG